ncbi:origin recognition complex subunit 1 [Nannochloropsis oceanica]
MGEPPVAPTAITAATTLSTTAAACSSSQRTGASTASTSTAATTSTSYCGSAPGYTEGSSSEEEEEGGGGGKLAGAEATYAASSTRTCTDAAVATNISTAAATAAPSMRGRRGSNTSSRRGSGRDSRGNSPCRSVASSSSSYLQVDSEEDEEEDIEEQRQQRLQLQERLQQQRLEKALQRQQQKQQQQQREEEDRGEQHHEKEPIGEEEDEGMELSQDQNEYGRGKGGIEGEGEEEEEEESEGVPAELVGPIGEGLEGDQYFEAVIWQGQLFRMGDCVEVLLDGSGKEEATTGYAEILWLWRSAAVAVQEEPSSDAGFSSSSDDDDYDKEESDAPSSSSLPPPPTSCASSQEGEAMMEVRWFWSPQELLVKKEDRTQCLLRELFESDRVDEIPVQSINDRIRVVAPRARGQSRREAWGQEAEEEEVFVCRRLYHSTRAAFLPLGPKAMLPEARRTRGMNYSARRDQTPLLRVPPPSLPPSLPCAGSCSAAVDKTGGKRNRNEEEGEEDEGQEGEEKGAGEGEDAGEDGRNKTGKKKERKGGREGGREGRLEEESEELALLSQAEARLHLSSSPWSTATKAASLPCRERETQEVMEFLEAALSDFYQARQPSSTSSSLASSLPLSSSPASSRGGLYIAGFPGTGKTATVHHVLGRLRKERRDLGFTHCEINGLTLSNSSQAYPLLWAALTDQREAGMPPARALAKLSDFFTSSRTAASASSSAASRQRRARPVVVVLDEMDYLVGKSLHTMEGKVIYNLLEWGAGGDGGRRGLILLGLSNTVDLPERVMQPRVQSRLSLRRVRFEPYSHLQVASILKTRLGGLVPRVIDDQCIQMCSRKVANVSGDLRKAFQVCRHAIDLKRRLLSASADATAAAAAAETSSSSPSTNKENVAAASNPHAPVPVPAAAGEGGGKEKEKLKGPLVDIILINQAARELQQKPIFKAVQDGLTDAQVLLLIAIIRSTLDSGRLEASMPEVYRRWRTSLSKMNLHPPSLTPCYGEAVEVAQRLALDGFLRLSKTEQAWAPFVTLQLQSADVAEAVRKGRPKAMYELLPSELREWSH